MGWVGRRQAAGQTACKPGSVLALRRWMAIPLGRPLPSASRDRPGRRRGNTAAGCPACRPYLVLLPVGFAKLSRSPGILVSSYLAISPLPCGMRRAVCFLWHFPSRGIFPQYPASQQVRCWTPCPVESGLSSPHLNNSGKSQYFLK